MATSDMYCNRDFENVRGQKLHFEVEEDDMDGLWVNLDLYNDPSSKESGTTAVFFCTIYEGTDDLEEIMEEFNECIEDIEDGYQTVLDLIMLARKWYIEKEDYVDLNVGWRGPGDTDGSDFKYNWTEEDEDDSKDDE